MTGDTVSDDSTKEKPSNKKQSQEDDQSDVMKATSEQQQPAALDVQEDVDLVLKDLVVLSPLQRKNDAAVDEMMIPLPPIRPEEPVATIRAALGEVVGLAHLTRYHLQLETPLQHSMVNETGGKSSNSKSHPPTISPYTGKNAVISVPVAVQSLGLDPQKNPTVLAAVGNVLDDFGDLSSLVGQRGLCDGSAFRIVLDRYDGSSIREHVQRLRVIFDGNAPSTLTLADEQEQPNNDSTEEESVAHSPSRKGTKSTSPGRKASNTTKGEQATTSTDANKSASSSEEKKEDPPTPPRDMPFYPLDKSVVPDTADLRKFFYLASGEEAALYSTEESKSFKKKKDSTAKSKRKGKNNKTAHRVEDDSDDVTNESRVLEMIPQLNDLEEKTRIPCVLCFSGFHPPPSNRRLQGDLAYLEVTLPGEVHSIHITATAAGFYINRSSSRNGSHSFNPTPSESPCFSHELLDCLLQKSNKLVKIWEQAIASSKARSKLTARLNAEGPFASLFRVAIRGDFPGYHRPGLAASLEGVDALIQTPSWVVPTSLVESQSELSWQGNASHEFNFSTTEAELSETFGVDIHGGAQRDWNEELQCAREMPLATLLERIERARVINKVLTDFGAASICGVKAIFGGQVAPMNPNESSRSQVYLHNNIFFSRAVDAGVETFKMSKGDNAAKKGASRDTNCLGALHRMERSQLYTLATVLIDYLGTRYVCQSILPGILTGEKTHSLLYGAVEAGSPLVWDKQMHELLEDSLGKSLMIATRPLLRQPLSEERVREIEKLKLASPLYVPKVKDDEKDEELESTIQVCAPLEAKGLKGSDQRHYVLDIMRVSPRDANWLPHSLGGTGLFEKENETTKEQSTIPEDLDDDEWTLAVLRPELVSSFAQVKMSEYLQTRKEAEKQVDKSSDAQQTDDGAPTSPDEKSPLSDDATDPSKTKAPEKRKFNEEDLNYLKSLRMNVNVFLPDMRPFDSSNEAAAKQIKEDEQRARDAAVFLWEKVLPRVTQEVREGSTHQIPHDGKSLTEFIHQYGVNCRYLGRLAVLAKLEEEKDQKERSQSPQSANRRSMPKFWLELLECEMVARASKHALDRYLIMEGGVIADSPSQTVAAFLSAVVSRNEESAAQTENRMAKSDADEDDFRSLTLCDVGSTDDSLASRICNRHNIWTDIEAEIGRRFRYSLTIFNRQGRKDSATYLPLLRRVCQRNGIRLAARPYAVGGQCYCGGGLTPMELSASYPISPLDILDIVPLMKHAAAHGEGFIACGVGPSLGVPALHISLHDARSALEAAHMHHSGRALSRALDLAQEACGLYQRVTETQAHPGIVRCIDLMASILFDAGEPSLAAANAMKALGLLIQIGGFDAHQVISAHLALFQMLGSSGQQAKAVKHLRAAIHLIELLGGPRHVELANAYHKLGTVYHGVNDMDTALRFYNEAARRESGDKLLDGMIAKSRAMVLGVQGQFKLAIDNEKRAFQYFKTVLGEQHQITRASEQQLGHFMAAAVHHGNKMVEDRKKQQQEDAALAIANEIEREETLAEERKNKKNRKKKSKK